MLDPRTLDQLIVTWGDRLFYPANRSVHGRPEPKLRAPTLHERAMAMRARIEATVVRRAPQVMVKVTGGGRGMTAIAAHFRYIAKGGRLDIEDDQGRVSSGRDAVRELVDDWRHAGSLIPDHSNRREAVNLILSMPRGVDPLTVLRAARDFAQVEFGDHLYAMVLHDHQAHPHVHLTVRAESRGGRRLNPRKADLQRWREVFAEKLRGWGIDAEATRQATRGVNRRYPALWQKSAAVDGRLHKSTPVRRTGLAADRTLKEAREAWTTIGTALAGGPSDWDRLLGRAVLEFVQGRSRDLHR